MSAPTEHAWRDLAAADPEVWAASCHELRRQEEGLELIASENFASRAVLQAGSLWLTNKYAEGVPGKRYYGGCEFVDQIERLACESACTLFQAEYANVQPHSGTQANMAVFMQVLEPGETMVAMDLAAGGHLTHGSPVNFSGKIYHVAPYGVRRDDERLDYDAIAETVARTRPKLLIAGASAYPRVIDFARFGAIAREHNVPLLVDMAHIAGLVAAGVHPSPVPHADFVTTTTHKTLRGSRGGLILARAQWGKKMDRGVCPNIQGGPLMHLIAGKAVALAEAKQPGFAAYQRRIVQNARALAAGLTDAGFRLVTGGTDNHLLLVDVRPQQLTGARAERALEAAGITVNKNTIPFDPEKPLVTSGIRLGTPALTTRGMGEREMRRIAELVAEALAAEAKEDAGHLRLIKRRVHELAAAFPIYRDLLQEVDGEQPASRAAPPAAAPAPAL